jgi:hypothetical protein
LAQTDEEHERYEARRKAQFDYRTGLKVARQEGLMEGELKGRTEGEINRIHFCERLLRRTESPSEKLATLSLEQLSHIARQLEEEVQKRV